MNAPNRLYRRRIGEILIAQGIVTNDQLEEALAIQKKTGELLGSILLDLGFVAESDIAKIICVQYQLPFITLHNYEFDGKLAALFPPEFLIRHRLLPFDKMGDTLLMLISEIPGEDVLAEIPKITKLGAALYVGFPSEVLRYLGQLYPQLVSGTNPGTGTPGAGGSQQKKDPHRPANAPIRGGQPATRPKPLPDDTPPPIQLVVETDTEADRDDGGAGALAGATAAPGGEEGGLFGGESKSFMDELDSTWESIFSGISGSKEDPDDAE